MKFCHFLSLLLIISFTSISCTTKSAGNNAKLEQVFQQTSFNIEEVYPTENYIEKIKNSITSLPGIDNISIQEPENLVIVTYDASVLTLENIATAVTTLEKGHSLKVYNMQIIAN
ncbi:Heavy-metal-associated domain-containing protein [Pustulibacterium marinum]|uniref:Heavy-metal-associated domain-containing protein n=1 Tax=Pustulibacterium marinum TaxID=1224947 RepID=A0A1I7EW60_9FLAO|nr:heavy-metal-associated domain-containing protein [Pustulibacterium marinum]SFU28188.1 Heavy-metal-associated domain-containing protein [Pustulibacterium marinum]